MSPHSAPVDRRSRPATPSLVAGTGLAAASVALVVWRLGALPTAAGAALALGGILLVLVPSGGVLAAVFLIYTNIPVVAARQEIIPKAVAASVGLLFLPAIIRDLVVRRKTLRLDVTFVLMGAFLAVQSISALVAAVDPALALMTIGTFLMEGLAIYLLVLNTVRNRASLHRVLAAVILAGSMLAGLAAYQAATRDYDRDFGGLAQRNLDRLEVRRAVGPDPEIGVARRARGPMDEPNRFAQILLTAAPFALFFAWTRKGGRRVLAATCGGLLLTGVLLTYSRGAFVALVTLVVVLAAMRYLRPSRLLAVLLAGGLLVPIVARGYVDRLHTIAGVKGLISEEAAVEPDGATRGRTTEMLAAALAYAEHPLLGVGPGQYVPHHSVRYQLRPEIAFRELPAPRRAHSLYLEIAAETGTAGLLVFLAIPGLLLRELWRLRRRARDVRPDLERLAVGFILAILAYLGTGVFLHLAFQRYYWLLVALTAAAVRISREELQEAPCSGS